MNNDEVNCVKIKKYVRIASESSSVIYLIE